MQEFQTALLKHEEQHKAAAGTAAKAQQASGSQYSMPVSVDSEECVPGEPEALAASTDSCTMIVSFDEPTASASTVHNVLFKSAEVAPFALAVDYTPTTVRPPQLWLQRVL
jgi:hypothetical protein